MGDAASRVYGLPWRGELELPPGGINHQYAPRVWARPDGRTAVGMRKVRSYTDWADAQVLLLRQQKIPRVACGTLLSIILEQRVRNVRADVDGNAKACLDVLATALSGTDGPLWDDRACHLLILSKVVDKTNPGVTVTVLPYHPDALRLVRDVLITQATEGGLVP